MRAPIRTLAVALLTCRRCRRCRLSTTPSPAHVTCRAPQAERGRRRLNFLLKQAEVFQHFAPVAAAQVGPPTARGQPGGLRWPAAACDGRLLPGAVVAVAAKLSDCALPLWR